MKVFPPDDWDDVVLKFHIDKWENRIREIDKEITIFLNQMQGALTGHK